MNQVINANLAKGRNAEHFTFHDNVLAAFTEEMAAELKIGPLRANYAALFRKEDQIYKYNSTEELTKVVKETDKVRDDLFSYLKQVVDANLICPAAAKKAAAEKLALVIKPYRDAGYRPYRENTGLIRNLLGDLQPGDRAASLEVLGLTETVELLKKANDDFNAVSTERADDRLVRDTSEKMRQIRPQVDEAYRAVTEAVNSLYSANELVFHDEGQAQTLGRLIAVINREVNEFQRGLAQRGAGKKADIASGGTPGGSGSGEGDTPGTGGGTPGTGGGNTGGENPGGSGDGDGGTSFD